MTGFLILAGSLAYCLGTLSASVPRWTAAYLFAGYAIVLLCLHVWRKGKVRIGEPELWLSALLGYFLLSLSWSPDPGEGLVRWVNGFAAACVFLYARHRSTEIGLWVHLAVLGGLVLCAVASEDIGGFGNRNFATEFFLVCLPLLWLGNLISAAVLSVAVLVYLLVFNGSNIEFLVFLVWGGGFLCYLSQSKARDYLVFIPLGIVALFLLIPSPHMTARYEIWIQTFFMWLDHPFFGVGGGGYDYVHALYRDRHIPYLGEISIFLERGSFAGAAHNEFFQVLAEFGVAGLVLCLGFVIRTLKGARLDRPEGWCLAGLAGMALIGFPLQNPATLLLGAMAFGRLSRA